MSALRAELMAGAQLEPPSRPGMWAAGISVVLATVLFVAAFPLLGISLDRLWTGLGQLGLIFQLMWVPNAGGHFATYFGSLLETLSIALLGTLLASVFAFPLGFLAARNVVASRLLRMLTRRSMDTVRSIDVLIWALIWINVVGLGPFAGLLAIASSDTGALAKLMSEAVETADRRAVEAVKASGGGWLHELRFGLMPQVLPVFVSQILYFFESNTRSATIIGIVGAGGIGLHLSEQIRVLEWQQAAFLILMVLVTVAIIDAVSLRLRTSLIGRRV